MLISAKQVTELTECLGTTDGLAHVRTELGCLNQDLAQSGHELSRSNLEQMITALETLNRAILQMQTAVEKSVSADQCRARQYVG